MSPGSEEKFCVTVFASSSSAVDESFKKAAFALGTALAEQGWIQCNGGGKHGLMGAATEGALAVGGVVDCVILEQFVVSNMHDGKFRDIVIENTMPLRKSGLYVRGDAFVCLPGGLGTLEEVSEVMSWMQLGMHSKPVFVNTNGFYDDLWTFYKKAISKLFVSSSCDKGIFLVPEPADVIEVIRNYKPIVIDKSSIHAGHLHADWTTNSTSGL